MKLLLVLLSGLFLFVGCDKGSIFNSEQMHPDFTTRIESAGWDLRVYEFTPNSSTTTQCIFVAGTNKAGLQCFDKK